MADIISLTERARRDAAENEACPQKRLEALEKRADSLISEDVTRDDALNILAGEETADLVGDLELQMSLLDLGFEGVETCAVPEDFRDAIVRFARIRDAGSSENSIRARRSDIAAYVTWAYDGWRAPLPSDISDLCVQIQDYLFGMAGVASPATINRRTSTLKSLVSSLGGDERSVEKSGRQAARSAQLQKKTRSRAGGNPEISGEDLKMLLSAIHEGQGISEGARLRDLAILRLSLDIMARGSELSNLRLRDLAWRGEERANMDAVYLSRASLPGGKQGVWASVTPETKSSIEAWVEYSLEEDGNPDDPVFCSIARDGCPRSGTRRVMSTEALNEAVDRHASRTLGERGRAYSISTLRNAVARMLWSQGVGLDEIVEMGRWAGVSDLRSAAGLPGGGKPASLYVLQ